MERYYCEFDGCNLDFGKPSRLLQHERVHTGEKPYACTVENCWKRYGRNQHLKRHMAIAHTSTQCEKLLCKTCSKSFSNMYTLKKHEYRYHVRNKYQCDLCHSSFSKQSSLKSHIYIHTGVKPYCCSVDGCNMCFESMSKLKRHSIKHSTERYICLEDSCNKKFDTFSQFRKHLSEDHQKVCSICGRNFKRQTQLEYHLVTHNSERKVFDCPYSGCDRFYFQKKNLQNHIRAKHIENSGFICDICQSRLSTKQKLMHHIKLHSKAPSVKKERTLPAKQKKTKINTDPDFAELLSGFNGDLLEPSIEDSNTVRGIRKLQI